MKLFKVETAQFSAFVVADNVLHAQKEFEDWLESEDYGYFGDRKVIRTHLIADTDSKPNPIRYQTELLLGMIKEDEK